MEHHIGVAGKAIYIRDKMQNVFRTLIVALSVIMLMAGNAFSEDVDGLESDVKPAISLNSEINQTDPLTEKPDVLRDVSLLPFPARRMHELILEATRTGDIEKLRALVGIGETGTQLSLGGYDGDPIEFLKRQSGDPEGHEILAILEEILEAGFVHLDKGTENEIYVWPYFFSYPLDELTPDQRVELFRIVTYGDYADMQDFGGYIFYRVGISPTGRWQFFVAGD